MSPVARRNLNTLRRLVGQQLFRQLESNGRTTKIVFRYEDVHDGLLASLVIIQNAVLVTNLTQRQSNNVFFNTFPNRVCANGHLVYEADLDDPEYSWASTPIVTVYKRRGTSFDGVAASDPDAFSDAEGDAQIFDTAGLGEEIAQLHFPEALVLKRHLVRQVERYSLSGPVVSHLLTAEEMQSLLRQLKECNLII